MSYVYWIRSKELKDLHGPSMCKCIYNIVCCYSLFLIFFMYIKCFPISPIIFGQELIWNILIPL